MEKNKGLIAICLIFLMNVASVYAEELETPKSNVILTVSGSIDKFNTVDKAEFDLAMLLQLKQSIIETKTPWTKGIIRFQGPKLSEVIALLGAKGTEIESIALNGYKIVIPIEDANKYSPILALKINGELMSIRDRGPSWIIYPWSDNKELQNKKYYTRSIWHLDRLIIK